MSDWYRIGLEIREEVVTAERGEVYVQKLCVPPVGDADTMRARLRAALRARGWTEHPSGLQRTTADGSVTVWNDVANTLTSSARVAESAVARVQGNDERTVARARENLADQVQTTVNERVLAEARAARDEVHAAQRDVYAGFVREQARALGTVTAEHETTAADGTYRLALTVQV